MKLVQPGYEILTEIEDGMQILKNIEQVARTCYKSEDKISDGSAETLIRNLLKRGHEAMIEHQSISVKFTVDRGVTHEFVRHRIASFAQESTRYVNYSKDKQDNACKFTDLSQALLTDTIIRRSKGIDVSAVDIEKILSIWRSALEYAEHAYMAMINAGASPQFARAVLPNSTKSEIVITANIREWRTLLKLRTEEAAHPQMREVCIPLVFEFQSKIPILFDDIIEKNHLEEYRDQLVSYKGTMNVYQSKFTSSMLNPACTDYILHHETDNKCFYQVYDELDDLGVKRAGMVIGLFDESLYSINPLNVTVEKDGEELVEKIRQECRVNPWYFLREIVKIPSGTKTGATLRLPLTVPQARHIYCMLNGINDWFIDDRQTGKTTITLAVYLWKFLFEPHNAKTQVDFVSIISTNMEKFQKMLLALPEYIRKPYYEMVKNPEAITSSDDQYRINCLPSKYIDDNTGRAIGHYLVLPTGLYIDDVYCHDNSLKVYREILKQRDPLKQDPYTGLHFTSVYPPVDDIHHRFTSYIDAIEKTETWRDEFFDLDPADVKKLIRSDNELEMVIINTGHNEREEAARGCK